MTLKKWLPAALTPILYLIALFALAFTAFISFIYNDPHFMPMLEGTLVWVVVALACRCRRYRQNWGSHSIWKTDGAGKWVWHQFAKIFGLECQSSVVRPGYPTAKCTHFRWHLGRHKKDSDGLSWTYGDEFFRDAA